MKDILFDEIDLENSEITDIDSYEKSYDYYEVTCKIDGEWFRILDTRNSRCSDLVFTDTQHEANHAKWIIRKLGGEGRLKQSWNHNPNTWDDVEDCGGYYDGFDGYYGDGLDCIDELRYMD